MCRISAGNYLYFMERSIKFTTITTLALVASLAGGMRSRLQNRGDDATYIITASLLFFVFLIFTSLCALDIKGKSQSAQWLYALKLGGFSTVAYSIGGLVKDSLDGYSLYGDGNISIFVVIFFVGLGILLGATRSCR